MVTKYHVKIGYLVPYKIKTDTLLLKIICKINKKNLQVLEHLQAYKIK